MRDWDYGFIAGKVRVLETRLIKRTLYERLASSKDVDNFLSILKETDYAKYESENFYRIIWLSEEDDRYLFEKYLPEKWPLNFLYARVDFQNLKVAIKSQIAEKPIPPVKVTGNYPMESILSITKGESESPSFLVETFRRAAETYYTTKDPVSMEVEIDKSMFHYLLHTFPLPSFIEDYIKREIDIFNISNILRYLVVDGKPFPLQFIVPYGTLPMRFYKDIVTLPLDEIPSHFKHTDYALLVESSFDSIKKKHFTPFIKRCSEYLLSILKKAIFITAGFEPIFRYYNLKEFERRNLRRIFAGIKNNLSREKIMEGIIDVN